MVLVNLHPKLRRDWINPWIAKQAYALWYQHAGSLIGKDGLVAVKWLTNSALMEQGVPDDLMELAQFEGRLSQGKKQVSDQFFYRYQISRENRLGVFAIGAHDGSLFVATVFDTCHKGLSSLKLLKQGDIFRTNSVKGIHSVPSHSLARLKAHFG